MHVLHAVDLLRLQALSRLGLTPRIVYRWVTDAESGKLFCIWLPQEPAEPTRPAPTMADERARDGATD